jgi:hypothetical protein
MASWLVHGHQKGGTGLLETTWKQAKNERFKVHEMEQLY